MAELREPRDWLEKQLPTLRARHTSRISVRKGVGGDISLKCLFEDMNTLRSLLIAVEAESLPALQLFNLYLVSLGCVADAWKMRLIMKDRYPEANVDTSFPDLVCWHLLGRSPLHC